MRSMVAGLKLFIFSLMVVGYFITASGFFFLAKIYRYQARKGSTKVLQFWAKAALKLIGIKCVWDETQWDGNKSGAKLIISNHLSYLDVLILSSRFPSCFITSMEMKKTPFLGQLCELGGCLYVERRSRKNLSAEIVDITRALLSGLNVVVFPEATSTNGEEVRTFKRPLFKAAVDSGVQVLPVSLNYASIDGTTVSEINRDYLFWYGDMSFLPHLWQLFTLKNIEVSIKLSESILPEGKDVTELAGQTHQIVSSNYRPVKKSLHWEVVEAQ